MRSPADAAADPATFDTVREGPAAAAAIEGRAYAWPLRALVGLLLACAGASLVLIFAAVVLGTDPPLVPRVLVWYVAVQVVAPWAAARALAETAAATLAIEGGALVIQRRRLRVEVPLDAIVQVRPWTLPLPGPGLAFRLRSGARLGWGLQLADPSSLLAALERAGVAPARAATDHPIVVWARARGAGTRPWHWYHYLLKFVVFGAPPGLILFRLHQWIAYGGTFGQYYMEGVRPYLESLALQWVAVVIYLVLWAAMLRGAAETLCLLVADVAPSLAARVRRLAELGCAIGYYGGVPLILGLRFLS
jgi:apolipoprotein N-acyltransferase